MSMHEYGDEFLRPTNQPWKCPKCGFKLFTVSSILSHKQRCTNNPNAKIEQKIDPTQAKRKFKVVSPTGKTYEVDY